MHISDSVFHQKLLQSLKPEEGLADHHGNNDAMLAVEKPAVLPTFVARGNRGEWSEPPRDCTKLWAESVVYHAFTTKWASNFFICSWTKYFLILRRKAGTGRSGKVFCELDWLGSVFAWDIPWHGGKMFTKKKLMRIASKKFYLSKLVSVGTCFIQFWKIVPSSVNRRHTDLSQYVHMY